MSRESPGLCPWLQVVVNSKHAFILGSPRRSTVVVQVSRAIPLRCVRACFSGIRLIGLIVDRLFGWFVLVLAPLGTRHVWKASKLSHEKLVSERKQSSPRNPATHRRDHPADLGQRHRKCDVNYGERTRAALQPAGSRTESISWPTLLAQLAREISRKIVGRPCLQWITELQERWCWRV